MRLPSWAKWTIGVVDVIGRGLTIVAIGGVIATSAAAVAAASWRVWLGFAIGLALLAIGTVVRKRRRGEEALAVAWHVAIRSQA